MNEMVERCKVCGYLAVYDDLKCRRCGAIHGKDDQIKMVMKAMAEKEHRNE